MVLHDPLHHVLVSSVAERRISRHLAVAKLIIARLSDIEGHWPIASDDPLALTVAEGANLRMSTATPVIRLAASKENMRRVNTGEGGQAWRSVTPFLVRTTFTQGNNFLLREVRHIIHRNTFARSRWSQNLRLWSENVTLVRLHLTASRTIKIRNVREYLLDIDVALDLVPVRLLWLVILVRKEEVDLLIHFIIVT